MSDISKKSVSIYIDQTAANLAIADLNAKAKELRDTIERGTAAGKNMNAEIKRLASTNTSIKSVQDQIDAGLRPSLNQTYNQVAKLRAELTKMSEDAPGYAEKFESFKKVSLEFNRMKESINGVARAEKSWMDQAKGVAFGVVIGNTIQAAIQSVTGYISGIVSGSAKMSDSLARVRQSTGLTEVEVKKLSASLRTIDTRTAQADLLKIAEIGGQMSVPNEQLKGFVENIDKASVVLGGQFGGGVEEITMELSLLRNVFTDIKTSKVDTDLGHIGNALLVLKQQGVETAPVIADFAKRLSPLISTAKLTSGEILGLGATMQEVAINPERGGTAMIKLFDKMISNADAFAKVAGKSGADFKALLQQDSFAAFKEVLVGFKKGGDNVLALNATIKDLETNGVGAKEALIKLSGATDILDQRVALGTKSLKETGKLEEEFALSNETLGAELDKLEKKMASVFQSHSLSEFIISIVRSFSQFIDILRSTPKFMKENQTAIYLLIVGISLMNATYIKAAFAIMGESLAKVENAVVTKALSIWNNIATASTMAYSIVVKFLTTDMKLAAAATEMWALATMIGLGPLGLVVVLLGAAMVAFNGYSNSIERLTAAKKLENEVNAKVDSAIQNETEKTRELVSVINDHNGSLDNRNKALQALIALNPKILEGLTLENAATADGKKKIDDYIQSLRTKAEVEAKQSLLQDKLKKKQELMTEVRTKAKITTNMNDEDLTNTLKPMSDSDKGEARTKKLNAKGSISSHVGASTLSDLKDVSEEVELLQAAMDKIAKQNVEAIVGKVKDVSGASVDATKQTIGELRKQIEGLDTAFDFIGVKDTAAAAKNRAKKKELEKQLAALEGKTDKSEKEQDSILQKLKDFKAELALIGKDSDEKEIDKIKKKYQELMALAVQHGVSLVGLEKEKNRALAFLIEEDRQKHIAERAKIFKEQAETDYENQLKVSADFFETKKQEQAKLYTEGIISKQQYELNLATIDVEAKRQDISTANDYANNSKKAATDLLTFKKNLTKEEIADAIKKREFLEENNKLLSELKNKSAVTGLQNKISNSPDGSSNKFNAQKDLRELQKQQELSAVEKQETEFRKRGIAFTNEFEIEKQAIRDKYKREDEKSEFDYYVGKINNVLNYVQRSLAVVNQINQAITNSENAAFQREVLLNNKRKTVIEQLGKSKVLTEVEAQRRLNQIAIEEDKKKHDLEVKQFNRNKAISIAQALINGALAITKDLVGNKLMIPFDIITTAVEVAAIASSSPKFGKGGALTGASHSFGGMPVINRQTGKIEAEMEGGEYILSRNTVANNKNLADMLLHSSMNQDGRQISLPQWQSRQYTPIDYAGITSKISTPRFASGGVYSYDNRPSTSMNGSENTASSQNNDEHIQLLSAVLHHLKNPPAPNLIFSTAKLDDANIAQARIVANASA